jgi:hypothetical protein
LGSMRVGGGGEGVEFLIESDGVGGDLGNELGLPGGGVFAVHEGWVEEGFGRGREEEVEFLVDGAEKECGSKGEGVVGKEEGLGGELSEKIENFLVVEGPEVEDAAGVLEEIGVSGAAGEGVEDFPRGTVHEDKACVGQERLPEREEEGGAWIFPAPECRGGMGGGFGGKDFPGAGGEVWREEDGVLSGPTGPIELIVFEDVDVEFEEVAVFEVSFDISDTGGVDAIAHGDAGGLEE